MADFRWIEVFLFLTLIVLTAGAILPYEPYPFSFTVRSGEEVTLPFSEHKSHDEVTLRCSVAPFKYCNHRVKWQFRDKDVEMDDNDFRTSESDCEANVTFLTSLFIYTPKNYELLKCKVNVNNNGVKQLFSPQFSGVSVGIIIMLAVRVAQILLLTVITVLLFKARGNQRPPADLTVHYDGNGRGGTVKYENVGEPSVSVPHPNTSFTHLATAFTGADIGQRYLFLSVRVGDEATLPCNSVTHDQDECDGTTWIFTDLRSTVILFGRGQIGKDAKAKSDRLSVTEKCSLVIKKVTEEDAGRYTCRQIRSGEQEAPDSWVELFVVTSEDTAAAESDARSGWWWWIIIVVIVGVAALTIITVAVIRRKRTQGQKPQTVENIVRYGVDDGTVNYDNIRPPDGV
ncbi:hypothetical protein JOQ06_004747 [Pogonophryne albipinna]|uniref:Ig-like domain-containing protein n=1 Tax=Pogonophryne albipinna TaxID=1090488 RepID=A0AAD6FCW8_9TELE|nr:hypothetical protein JOQ06_004747 [Pogonophryne albipinna]